MDFDDDAILGAVADDKVGYVSCQSGKIVQFSIGKGSTTSQREIRERGRKKISLLKLSKDSSFLIAYIDIDNDEAFFVYNTLTGLLSWEGKLDLS